MLIKIISLYKKFIEIKFGPFKIVFCFLCNFQLYNISVNNDGSLTVRFNKQKNMNFVQSFHYYEGAEGNNRVFANRSSGAYIFRPKQSSVNNFVYTGSYKIYKGIIYISSWNIRLLKNTKFCTIYLLFVRSCRGRASLYNKRMG